MPSNRLRQHLASAVFGVCTISAAHAASFALNIDGQIARSWEPFAAQGLVAVMSGETEWISAFSRDDYHHYERFGTRGAVYGSDTSTGDGFLDPRLKGYAVEPMADVQIHYEGACSWQGNPLNCSGAWFNWSAFAMASVNHRVVQRGNATPEVQSVLDELRSVPVYFDYSLSAQMTPVDDAPYYFSFASAEFALSQGSDTLAYRKACTGHGCTGTSALAGRLSMTLAPSDSSMTSVYRVGVVAQAGMRLGLRSGVYDGQAIADPFISIDPNWAYARYFMVQQESQLNPGTWVETTRLWQPTSPAPEPATWSLLLGGIGAVVLCARRRQRSTIA